MDFLLRERATHRAQRGATHASTWHRDGRAARAYGESNAAAARV